MNGIYAETRFGDILRRPQDTTATPFYGLGVSRAQGREGYQFTIFCRLYYFCFECACLSFLTFLSLFPHELISAVDTLFELSKYSM